MTTSTSSSALDVLKRLSIISADTAEIDEVRRYIPHDVTTNPSLLLKAVKIPEYRHILEDVVIESAKWGGQIEDRVEKAVDLLSVKFGVEILKIIPGRVSSELDPQLSYNAKRTCKRGARVMQMFKEAGVDPNRVLLKVASTWEGFQAAKKLEKDDIHVNMTLMFSLAQAAVAIDCGVHVISPFIGRITDYYKEKDQRPSGFQYTVEEDPGIRSLVRIYNYVKKTAPAADRPQVLAASFRSPEQIKALAGCDILTISPELMKKLSETTVEENEIQRRLYPEKAKAERDSSVPEKIETDEQSFRAALDGDAMTSMLLKDGIKKFIASGEELRTELRRRMER